MPRTAPSADIASALVQHGTRTGITQMLEKLHASGLLDNQVLSGASRTIRRKLQQSIEAHAGTKTPYGPVVCSLYIGLTKLRDWEYCNPIALVYHLCNISRPFYNVLTGCATPGRPLRIVIYIDGCEPGNPLRPEKSRELQCVYWTFADFPGWLLSRTAAWFVFGFLRTTLADELPGGLSDLMRRVLHVFFPREGESFSKGIVVQNKEDGGATVVKAMFAGFLADESAHKHVYDVKGASGFH